MVFVFFALSVEFRLHIFIYVCIRDPRIPFMCHRTSKANQFHAKTIFLTCTTPLVPPSNVYNITADLPAMRAHHQYHVRR